jgi:hypothetical protein
MMDWLTENAWRVPELAVTFLLLSAVVAAWAFAAKCLAERRWLLVRRVSDQEALEQSRHWRDKSDRDDAKYDSQYDRIDEALPRIEASMDIVRDEVCGHQATDVIDPKLSLRDCLDCFNEELRDAREETNESVKQAIREALDERKPPRGAGGRFASKTEGGETNASQRM